MPKGELAVAARVSGVCHRDRVAARDAARQRLHRDLSAPSAIADALELAVPLFDRHPDFDRDVGIARGSQRSSNPAKRRQRVVWTKRRRTRRENAGGRCRELSGRHELRARDLGIRQRKRPKTLA